MLTRPFWTFQHRKTCCILKKANDFYGFDWNYLFSCPVFSVEGLGSGGGCVRKAREGCCGEVGTFKNIVACHHKMIDDTDPTVSRLNNDWFVLLVLYATEIRNNRKSREVYFLSCYFFFFYLSSARRSRTGNG